MGVKSRYNLVVICQVYNELEKGNLERFFTYTKPLVDHIVIYDDVSTDGTYEYCLEQTPHVIRGKTNNFQAELFHKEIQLKKALELKPDFIIWLDADEIISTDKRADLEAACDYCIEHKLDGLNFHELNLWRSHTYRRTDSYYDDGWFTRLWRVKPGLSFGEPKEGLHQRLVPVQVEKTANIDQIALLHYGFSSDCQLAYKYFTYKAIGQRGYLKLDRFVDESKLELERVDKKLFPKGLWQEEEAPKARTMEASFEALEQYRAQVRRPKYSIVCLIYKSVDWLTFAYEQVLKYTDLNDCEFFFVANDAEPQVLEYLDKNYIPYVTFTSTEEQKKEWHINRVYRAYNYGAQVARGDFLVFINSDMAYSPNWLTNMVAGYDGANCLASRLVESGKLRTGTHGLEKNFGKEIADYKEEEFINFAAELAGKPDEVRDSGLFMPLLIKKSHFESVGGYPEGNIREGSDIFKPVIAKQGEALVSGDNVLMRKLATKGIKHQTAWGSVVYHFQAGELDQDPQAYESITPTPIAIANDIVTGTVGERVLWDFLIEGLPGAYGVDHRLVGKKNFEKAAKAYIDKEHPETEAIIQNATFIGTVDPDRHTIAFLQDDMRKMQRDSVVQEANLEVAKTVVTNSIQTASSYPEYDCEIIPVGIDDTLFKPVKDKATLRKKHGIPEKKQVGIFVGSFSEVKGWSRVVECIKAYSDMHWICVTKYDETFTAPNATVFARIDQKKLVELLNCADFFILGSPVETQCLAALEAALCDIPVVMPKVGIFIDFTEAERARLGVFTNDLKSGVKELSKGKYAPRATVLERNLGVRTAVASWHKLLEQILMQNRAASLQGSVAARAPRYRKYRLGMLFRKKVIKKVIGREYIFPSTAKYALLRGTYKLLVQLGLEPIIIRIRKR